MSEFNKKINFKTMGHDCYDWYWSFVTKQIRDFDSDLALQA